MTGRYSAHRFRRAGLEPRLCDGTTAAGKPCGNVIAFDASDPDAVRRWKAGRCGRCSGDTRQTPQAKLLADAASLHIATTNDRASGLVMLADLIGLDAAVTAAFCEIEDAAWQEATSGQPGLLRRGITARVSDEQTATLLSLAPPGGDPRCEQWHLRLLGDYRVSWTAGGPLHALVSGTEFPSVLAAVLDQHHFGEPRRRIAERAAHLRRVHDAVGDRRAREADEILHALAHDNCDDPEVVAAALSGASDPAAAAEAVLDGCRDPRGGVQRGLGVPVAQMLLNLGDVCPPAVVAAAVWHPVTAAAAAAHPLATSDDKTAAQRTAAGLGRRSQRTHPRQCGRRTKDGFRCTVKAKRLVDGDWCGRCAGIPDTHHTLWSPAHLSDDYVPLAADAALHEGMRLPYAKAQAAAAGAPHSGWRRRLDELRSDLHSGVVRDIADSETFAAALRTVAGFSSSSGAVGAAVVDIDGSAALTATNGHSLALCFGSTVSPGDTPTVISPELCAEIISAETHVKGLHTGSDGRSLCELEPGPAAGPATLDADTMSALHSGRRPHSDRFNYIAGIVAEVKETMPVDPTSGAVTAGNGAAVSFDTATMAEMIKTVEAANPNHVWQAPLIEFSVSHDGTAAIRALADTGNAYEQTAVHSATIVASPAADPAQGPVWAVVPVAQIKPVVVAARRGKIRTLTAAIPDPSRGDCRKLMCLLAGPHFAVIQMQATVPRDRRL